MRVALALLLASAFLLPSLPLADAAGEPVRHFEWEYRVSLPDPASGSAHVVMTLRNLSGIVDRMTLITADHRDPITNVTGAEGTVLATETGGFSFAVDSNSESLSFDVRVVRPAFKPGEYLSWAGEDFALFKAEAFAVAYTYRYYEGKPFDWTGRVVFDPPPGWRAEGPWERTGPDAFVLPSGEVLPRGYVVMGPFDAPQENATGGKSLRYVRIGNEATYEKDLVDYIDRATPYYEAVYGPGTGPVVLAINAPDPMFRGGLGATDSFFVHESADLRTLAHEYAHVFQRFSVEESPGRSAIWVNEGDADYHSALSLLAAEFWSPADVNKFLSESAKDREDPAFATARLLDAGYGNSLERFAYHKGATVLHALDAALKQESGGVHGVADLVRRLNERYAHTGEREPTMVDSEIVMQEVGDIVSRDFTEFFSRFVTGTAWPDPPPFSPEGGISLSNLTLEPPRASPGEPVRATVKAHNTGTKPISKTLELTVGGNAKDAHALALAVGQSTLVTFDFVAPLPGVHEVRVSYLREDFHSLTAPDLRIGRISFVPSTLRAEEPARLLLFLENAGETPGAARVEAIFGDRILGTTPETHVDGNASEALTIPILFTHSGPADLVLRLTTSAGQESERVLPVYVAEADRDRDGVPDALDGYPENPMLTERSTVNDARDAVPAPPLVVVALLVAILALARRRR